MRRSAIDLSILFYRFATLLLISSIFVSPPPALAENIAPDESARIFVIKPSPEQTVTFQLKGTFQTDYLFYTDKQRTDNRFHIRRAQLELNSSPIPWLALKIKYELKNNVLDHLMDAYAETSYNNLGIRVGRFKKPFGLDYQTEARALLFAERSMSSFLSPGRDIGIMLHGSFLNKSILYAGGLFNAEGDNVTNRSDGKDDPEIIGRVVFAPFANSANAWLKQFQFGGSASFAKINLANLDFTVKSAGMIDTNRSIYVLSHDTKFGVLQDVDNRWRGGIEAAWAYKTVALQGEYIRLAYTGLKPAGSPARDAKFSSWYVSGIYFPTGENPSFADGTMQIIQPLHCFDPANGYYGAFGLAGRFQAFHGDKNWINENAHVSVEKADGFSLAVNWILFPMHRMILDFTYTDFSDPIRVRVQNDGSIDYIDKENVVTLKYCIYL